MMCTQRNISLCLLKFVYKNAHKCTVHNNKQPKCQQFKSNTLKLFIL